MTSPPDWADVPLPPEPDEPDDDGTPPPQRNTAPPPAPPIPATSDTAAQSERARVLRHPEIAARLTQPPIRFDTPEQWNGYVPPELWREQANDSPQRKALLEIITAAVQADAEQTHGSQ